MKEELYQCDNCLEMFERRHVVRVNIGEQRCFCRWCWEEMNNYFVSGFDNDIYC